jgi:hypothetical protein
MIGGDIDTQPIAANEPGRTRAVAAAAVVHVVIEVAAVRAKRLSGRASGGHADAELTGVVERAEVAAEAAVGTVALGVFADPAAIGQTLVGTGVEAGPRRLARIPNGLAGRGPDAFRRERVIEGVQTLGPVVNLFAVADPVVVGIEVVRVGTVDLLLVVVIQPVVVAVGALRGSGRHRHAPREQGTKQPSGQET